MRRLFLVSLLAGLMSACFHPWVGKPVAQLEKAYGRPLSVLNRGDSSVYYYPDYLAGRGQMTFIVDHKGIIRSWCATTDVPSVFDDINATVDAQVGPPINTGASLDPTIALTRNRRVLNEPPANQCR